MKQPAIPRRRSGVIALALLLLSAGMSLIAQRPQLTVGRQGDRLRLSAPDFHFLAGVPLERLRNGATVSYEFTVTIEPASRGHEPRVRQRYVVSYDLWEERFAVVVDGGLRRTVANLTAPAAEAWCLDSLAPAVAIAPTEQPFRVRLECSVVPEPTPGTDEGLTLSKLIDVFSRKGATAPPRWELLSAPLRLLDLKDKAGR